MDQASIAIILASHYVKVRIVGGKLQAQDLYTVRRPSGIKTGRRWITVEGFTMAQLREWLCY